MSTATLGTWRNPPLAYVVAEVVISPYYSMASMVPAIQDALRLAYPRTVEAQELVFDPTPTVPPPQPQRVWQLISADQRHGVQLGPRVISLHATSYLDSKDFLARWAAVLDAVAEANLDAYVERAGLRYVDLIVPSQGRVPSDYLAAGLQGVTMPDGGALKASMWLVGFDIGSSTVNARTAAPSPDGVVLPPNFVALPLRKPDIMTEAEKLKSEQKSVGFIDVDCISAVGAVFDAAALTNSFAAMQKITSKTFRSVLSSVAFKEWE